MSGLAHRLLLPPIPRSDGMAPPRDASTPDWAYGIFDRLNGNYRADPGMVVAPPNSPRMPDVPDYQLNQHLSAEGALPASYSPSINPMTGLPEFNFAANAGPQMSQTMMPPGGMPQGGGGMPQLPPQVLQMLMQRMQGGGQPPMGGPPPAMQGPMGAPNMPNPGQGGMPPGGPPGGMMAPQGPPPMTAPQMAAAGRFGDSIVAHVTPGEISIPPQVQTPQLIALLQRAFQAHGVNLSQFTAGSPAASRNPNTGAPELSLWSALLPIVGAIGGSFIPGLGTAAGAALGGAAGGAAGGLIDHQTPLGVALSAAGGGVGGYMAAPAGAAGGALGAAEGPTLTGATLDSTLAAGAPGAASSLANPFAASSLGEGVKAATPYLKMGLGASTGAGLGGALAPAPQTDPLANAGFHKQLGPINPNFNAVRGAPGGSTPTFTNYNPYAAVTGGGYNFYPGGS